jgi:hypothetical protein
MPSKRQPSPIPRGATHVKLVTPEGTSAESEVKNIDWVFSYPFRCPGKLIFLKKTRKGFDELGVIEFDGVWPPKVDTPSFVT